MNYQWINHLQKKRVQGSSAAVIRYDQEKDAVPVVVAQGKGQIAERIIQLAKEHDIPMHQDAELVGQLLELDLGEQIPPQLYAVMAEILVLIHQLEKRY